MVLTVGIPYVAYAGSHHSQDTMDHCSNTNSMNKQLLEESSENIVLKEKQIPPAGVQMEEKMKKAINVYKAIEWKCMAARTSPKPVKYCQKRVGTNATNAGVERMKLWLLLLL